MPEKRELLGQGDRGKRENEKLRRTLHKIMVK